MTYREQLMAELDRMPPDKAEAVAAALLEQIRANTTQDGNDPAGQSTPERSDYRPFVVSKRMAGLGKGRVELAPDFDAPLPASFWLGEP